jgi:hypothetical protein
VFEALRDPDFVDGMVERAYTDVIGSGAYSYARFIRMVDAEVAVTAAQVGPSSSGLARLSATSDELPSPVATHPARAAPPVVVAVAPPPPPPEPEPLVLEPVVEPAVEPQLMADLVVEGSADPAGEAGPEGEAQSDAPPAQAQAQAEVEPEPEPEAEPEPTYAPPPEVVFLPYPMPTPAPPPPPPAPVVQAPTEPVVVWIPPTAREVRMTKFKNAVVYTWNHLPPGVRPVLRPVARKGVMPAWRLVRRTYQKLRR